jgi:hypothetical protein
MATSGTGAAYIGRSPNLAVRASHAFAPRRGKPTRRARHACEQQTQNRPLLFSKPATRGRNRPVPKFSTGTDRKSGTVPEQITSQAAHAGVVRCGSSICPTMCSIA